MSGTVSPSATAVAWWNQPQPGGAPLGPDDIDATNETPLLAGVRDTDGLQPRDTVVNNPALYKVWNSRGPFDATVLGQVAKENWMKGANDAPGKIGAFDYTDIDENDTTWPVFLSTPTWQEGTTVVWFAVAQGPSNYAGMIFKRDQVSLANKAALAAQQTAAANQITSQTATTLPTATTIFGGTGGAAGFTTYEVIFRQGGQQVPIEQGAQQVGPGLWQTLPGVVMTVGNAATDGSGVAGSPGQYQAYNKAGTYSGDPLRGVLVRSVNGIYAVPQQQLVAWFGQAWNQLPFFGGTGGYQQQAGSQQPQQQGGLLGALSNLLGGGSQYAPQYGSQSAPASTFGDGYVPGMVPQTAAQAATAAAMANPENFISTPDHAANRGAGHF